MTRDPNSYIQASADALAETLLSKNSDYAPTGEFSNFEKTAAIAGISVLQLITAQVAIKMTRIEKLLSSDAPAENESLQDSFLDLAGYATIAHAWMESGHGWINEQELGPTDFIEDRETIRNSANDEAACFHSWLQAGNDVSECIFCMEQRHG